LTTKCYKILTGRAFFKDLIFKFYTPLFIHNNRLDGIAYSVKCDIRMMIPKV